MKVTCLSPMTIIKYEVCIRRRRRRREEGKQEKDLGPWSPGPAFEVRGGILWEED